MRKQSRLLLFAIILIANIAGGISKNQLVDYISKPLIIISLAGYFLSQTKTSDPSLKKWILLALFFSWAGDVLLLFQNKKEIFFLIGLVCFLLTHCIYAFNFEKITKKEKVGRNWFFTLVPSVFGLFLFMKLSSHLGNMKWPVAIYAGVLVSMVAVALHLIYIKNRVAGYCIVTGALLFLVSDSVLAINKFYQPFEIANVVIMLTYGLAQLFIVEGAIRYISFNSKE